MIENVEFMTGGASPAYGSDAIAGMMDHLDLIAGLTNPTDKARPFVSGNC